MLIQLSLTRLYYNLLRTCQTLLTVFRINNAWSFKASGYWDKAQSRYCVQSFCLYVSLATLLAVLPGIGSAQNPTKSYNAGAYIIDMGQSTQTVANGLKPYGLVYACIQGGIPVDWSINSYKAKDGIDFYAVTAANGNKAYKGGSFIIPFENINSAVITLINTWKALGVVVDGPVTTSFTLPFYKTLSKWPRAFLDAANDQLIQPYYANAGVPTVSYVINANPTMLPQCGSLTGELDVYILPHADPDTWDITWITALQNFINNGGSMWAGCHAVSVMENLPGCNFLSNGGLVPFGNHPNGVPPYSYTSPSNPFMQFIGILDGATQNGSEQIYVPGTLGWRTTTTISVYDPNYVNASITYPNTAAIIAFGPAFGTKGLVMYESAHQLNQSGTVAEQVAAQRAFFNFLLDAGTYTQLSITPPAISNQTATTCSGTLFSVTPSGTPSNTNYTWLAPSGTGFTGGSAQTTPQSSISQTLTNTGTSTATATYTVTPQIGGCLGNTFTLTVTVLAPPLLSSTLTPAAICSGTTFSYIAISGETGATFSWTRAVVSGISNGAGNGSNGNISEILNNTTAAAVVVTYAIATTAYGCTNTQNVTVIVNPLPAAPTTVNATPVTICAGGSSNLKATSAGNTIRWYTVATGGSSLGTSASGANFSVSPASTTTYYAESLISSSGCVSATRSAVTVTVIPLPDAPATVTAMPAAICNGGTSNLNAISAGNTIRWYTVATGGSAIGTSASGADFPVTPVISTTYYAEALTPAGCLSATRTAVIITVNSLPAAPTPVNASPAAICFGGTSNLNAASAGNTIQWYLNATGGTTIGTSASGANFSVTPVATDTYYAEALTASGCTSASRTAVTVTVNPLPAAPTAVTSTPASICAGGSSNLKATSAGNTIRWYTVATGGSSIGSSANGANFPVTPATTTTYYAESYTAAGCAGATRTAVTVTVISLPVLSSPLAPAALCSGTTFTYTAASSTTGATFSWIRAVVTGISNSAGSGLNGNISETLTNTTTSPVVVTYAITTTANGCSNSQSVTVTINPLPAITVTPASPSICLGSSSLLTASGGTSYNWSPATGLSATTGTTVSANPATTTTYTITGTDPNGCINTTTVTVTVNTSTVSASATPDPVCVGSTLNLSSSNTFLPTILLSENFNSGTNSWTLANTSNGGTPVNAAWTLQPNGYVTGCSGDNTAFHSNDNSQFYLSNSCAQGTGGTTHTTLQSPVMSTIGFTTLSLDFYHYFYFFTGATGKVEVSTNGTTWTQLATYNTTQGSWATFAHAIINLNAYIGYPTFYVHFKYDAPWSWYWAIDNVTISGTASSPLSWTGPSGFTSALQNPVISNITPASAGTYIVTYTNPITLCSASNSVSVSVNSLPAITVTPSSAAICIGSGTSLTASGAVTYSWSPSTGLSATSGATVTANPLTTTTYTVTGTDANGCINTATVNVAVNSLPAITVTPASVTICNGSSTTLTAGGAQAYNWSPATGLSGTTGAAVTANPVTATTYTVTGTDANGCNNTATVAITVNPTPVTAGVTICQGGSAGSLTSSSVCPNGSAITVGPLNAGTGSNVAGVGTIAWGNPGNAISNGGGYATANLTGPGTKSSQYLRTTNYGFSIPGTASIVGITLTISRLENTGPGASTNVRDIGVSLLKAGAIVGNNFANTTLDWPTAITSASYGGSSNLWGAAWLPSDINAPTFGASLYVGNDNDRTASVDYLQISVTYTQPGTLTWYTVSSGGSSIGTGSPFNPVGVTGSGLPNTNNPGTYTFYAECSSVPGCRTPTNYIINPNPAITAISLFVCSGTAFSISPANGTNGIVPVGTTYSWSAPAGTGFTGGASGSGALSISGTLINTTSNPVTATYTVTPSAGSCTGSTFTVTVTLGQTTGIWQGGTSGSETDWNTAANWSCGGVPTSITDVTIPAGRTYYPVIGSPDGICRTITDIAGGSISGTGSLSIVGNSGIAITNISGNSTISCPVIMPLSGSVAVATNIALTISGVISGAATNFTMAGPGTLILSGTNSYNGTTTVNSGHLIVQNGSALGTSTGGTTVNSGFLDLQGGITVSAEPMTLAGNGVLENVSGNNFWGGAMTITGPTTGIYGNANTLTITNTINLNANQLTIQGAAATVVSGVISNTGSIHKAGQGSLTLSGTNTFSGGLDLNNGQLNINSTAALGTGTLRITEGANGNTLKIDNTSGTSQLVSNAVYWNDPFLFTGTNPLTLSGSVILGSGVSGTRSVSAGSTTNFLTIGGTISDGSNGLGFAKLGAGTLVLTGSGTYSGATILPTGELRLNPAANSTLTSPFVLNGATLGTTSITSGRTITSSSTLQLSDNSTLNLGTNAHTLTFANSASTGWMAGKTLIINGWTGPPGGPGTAGRIFFGASTGTLLSSQLAEIRFSGYPGVPKLTNFGELVPASDAILAITGTPTDFGSLCLGAVSAPVTYTITNTNATATGVTVTSSNSQFVVSSLSSTTIIGDGGTATFLVTFTPTGVGSQSTTITVASSSGNSPAITLTGTGNVLPAALVLTGSTICISPGGNGTITSGTSVTGINYQLYNSAGTSIGSALAGSGSGVTWSNLPAGNGYYAIGTNATISCVSSGSNLVNVSTNANPSISGTLVICAGSSTQMTGSGTPASTNPWVSSSTGIATVSNSGLVTGVSAGTSVITYKDINGCTSTTTVTVNALPAIITQPANELDCEGHIVSFNVVATGTGLTYSWQRKYPSGSFVDIPLTGESNVSYPSAGTIRLQNVGNSDAPDLTQYRVVISNSDGCIITSNAATLTVNEITGITPISTNVTICQGSNYSYLVTTSYPSNVVSYQWKKWNNPGQWDPITDGGAISGATTANLVFTNATPAESGQYKVTVIFHSSGADCNVTSDSRNRTLNVNPTPQCAISGNTSVFAGSTSNIFTSTPNPSDNVTHLWSITGNGTISGSNTGLTVTVNATSVGSFTLTDNISRYSCGSSCSTTISVIDLPCSISPSSSVTNGSSTVYTGPALMDSYSWSVSGNGSIPSSVTNLQTATVLAGNNCSNYSLTLAIVKNGATSTCSQTIPVTDNILPSFTLPAPLSACVESLYTAVYFGATMDINPDRPDYYTFLHGDTSIDLNTSTFTDNCDLSACLPPQIRWQIDFVPTPDLSPPHSMITKSPVTGMGQPSAIIGSILFPGDGINFTNVVHTITYWIKDCAGNESLPQTLNITIKPRPNIVKIN